jgi:hypothetical protein
MIRSGSDFDFQTIRAGDGVRLRLPDNPDGRSAVEQRRVSQRRSLTP